MSYPLALLMPALSGMQKKISRAALVYPTRPFLSRERRIALERWARGREQLQKLRRADGIVVSFGKSGRTWLRVMLSRFYQLEHDIPENILYGFDNLNYVNRSAPRLFFTHDNYVKDYTGNHDNKADYYDSKVVLLVRHPADVAVSQYHQWRYRMRDNKKTINNYPDDDVSLFDFVMREEAGLAKVIDFMNLWAAERHKLQDFLVVRYEDLKADAAGQLDAVTRFLGTPGGEQTLKGAVEYASFENMRKLETGNPGGLMGLFKSGRLTPRDATNPKSFKTRRGKVGGFRDYFTEDQVDAILHHVDDRLDPVYGYTRLEGQSAA